MQDHQISADFKYTIPRLRKIKEENKQRNLVPRPDFEFAQAAMKYLTEEENEMFMDLCMKISTRWAEENHDGESYSG